METQTKITQKTRRAVVTSKRGDKSITVQIDYLVKHPKYGKYIRRRTKLGVHDPNNQAGVGDIVDIAECRPISKMISWRLVNIVKKAVIE
ncbi:MAG: 30S ribosomal protein S17 [Planctomycetes bacterium]|jgi:small subunit ribosomal protein S17|nr:30S ribosomal protein S17 [Planctomycetota bacterium]